MDCRGLTISIEPIYTVSLQVSNIKSKLYRPRWWVPISYTVAGGNFNRTDNWLWLSPQDESKSFVLADIKDPTQTLIFNVQHLGFYRLVLCCDHVSQQHGAPQGYSLPTMLKLHICQNRLYTFCCSQFTKDGA